MVNLRGVTPRLSRDASSRRLSIPASEDFCIRPQGHFWPGGQLGRRRDADGYRYIALIPFEVRLRSIAPPQVRLLSERSGRSAETRREGRAATNSCGATRVASHEGASSQSSGQSGCRQRRNGKSYVSSRRLSCHLPHHLKPSLEQLISSPGRCLCDASASMLRGTAAVGSKKLKLKVNYCCISNRG